MDQCYYVSTTAIVFPSLRFLVHYISMLNKRLVCVTNSSTPFRACANPIQYIPGERHTDGGPSAKFDIVPNVYGSGVV